MANSLAEGKTEQFLQLYAGCEGKLSAYLMTLLGNYNDVQDVLQETLLALWQSFGEFEPGTNFLAWARKAAYHRALTFRKQQRRQGIPCSEAFLAALDRAYERKGDRLEEYLRYLEECIALLPDTDRQILAARFQSEGPSKAAAEALGRPVNTVYKALARIYRVLATCVERLASREERP